MRQNISNTAYVPGAIVIILLAWISTGCGTSAPPQPTDAEPGTEAPLMEHAEHQDSAEDQGEEVRAALAGLSTEDRQSAQRQRICPVSGEPLGSMGEPIIERRITHRGISLVCAAREPGGAAWPGLAHGLGVRAPANSGPMVCLHVWIEAWAGCGCPSARSAGRHWGRCQPVGVRRSWPSASRASTCSGRIGVKAEGGASTEDNEQRTTNNELLGQAT